MADGLHPAATPHLPPFVTPPGETDVLLWAMAVFLIAIILILGNLYLRLHALPERMAHRAGVVQFQLVAVLALLALFTHEMIFWVAALILALVRFPDFSTPIDRMSGSLDRIASAVDRGDSGPAPRGVPPGRPSEPLPGTSRGEGPGPAREADVDGHPAVAAGEARRAV